MERRKYLVVGAGVSGLATAAALAERGERDVLVLEAGPAIGGYCKTIRQDGFVWDYSGHFFHFKNPAIEAWLRERMPGQNIVTVQKRSFIDFKGRWIDFPFQKNIHQLPRPDFIECLHDFYFAEQAARASSDLATPKEESFYAMLMARFGRGICEKFLIPYNEKLYATNLAALDPNAMGRFFPHANLDEVVRNMKSADNASYNSSFTYPEGGAIEYVKAIASAVAPEAISLSEPLLSIDLERKVAKTTGRSIEFEHLVSSAPFDTLLRMAQVAHDPAVFSWNKVLVFNLGFDRKGPPGAHWVYYPARDLSFYRVGFYDNIFDSSRMSLYVEVGFAKDAKIDVAATRAKVLEDLKRVRVVTDQKLIAEHSVVMDPAYVHITQRSIAEHARLAAQMAERGVHSIGRYGGWTYCSIEDNIVEARALVANLVDKVSIA